MLDDFFKKKRILQLPAEALLYHCNNQNARPWVDRAEIATDLVSAAAALSGYRAFSLADIGCGDGKLGRLLKKAKLPLDYRGFDLVPQTSAVTKHDIQNDILPMKFEVVSVLGVLEYVEDARLAIARLASKCEYLVVSHMAHLKDPSQEKRDRWNWRSFMPKDEFANAIQQSGFSILGSRFTADGQTVVCLCKSRTTDAIENVALRPIDTQESIRL